MTVLVTGGAGYIGSHMVHALLDAGERVVVLDNLSTGLRLGRRRGRAARRRRNRRSGAGGAAHRANTASTRSSISPPPSWCPNSVRDPLGYYRNNTANSRALIECAVKGGVRHFIFSSTAAVYGNPAHDARSARTTPTLPMSPYGWSKLMTEIMLRDAGAAHGLRHVILRYFNVAGADPQRPHRPIDPRRDAPDQGRGRDGARQARRRSTCSAPIIRRRTAPASATTSTSAISSARIRDALAYLRSGGAPVTLNCGYGHGFSVLEVIDAVKRVSGVDFKVETRRAGGRRSRADRGGVRHASGEARLAPAIDDLSTIVAHALAWERQLPARRAAQSGERQPSERAGGNASDAPRSAVPAASSARP